MRTVEPTVALAGETRSAARPRSAGPLAALALGDVRTAAQSAGADVVSRAREGLATVRSITAHEALAVGGLGVLAVVGAVELPVVAAVVGVAWLTRSPRRPAG